MSRKCRACTLILVFISLTIAVNGLVAFAAAEKDTKQEKVATVNGDVITKAQFDQEMSRYEQQMAMAGQTATPEQVAEMKEKVLKGLVDRELLVQQTKAKGVTFSEAELNEQIATLKKRFPSEEQFTAALTKMNITEDQLKKELGQDMAIRKLIDQELGSKVAVTDQEAKAFYDEHPDYFKTPEMVRASHILIKVDPKASEADKAKAHEKIVEIQKKLQNGADFATLAKESSDDTGSAAKGGDLNYFQRGQMVGPFEEAAFSLKPGTLSDVVETQYGYHLIKVTDKKEPGVTPYDEIKERIEKHLNQEKINEELVQYVAQLRSKAKIETFVK